MSIKYKEKYPSSTLYNNKNVNIVKVNGEYKWCRPFTLTYSGDIGVSKISITRVGTLEPSAKKEAVPNEGVIYYGDQLAYANTPAEGYFSLYFIDIIFLLFVS